MKMRTLRTIGFLTLAICLSTTIGCKKGEKPEVEFSFQGGGCTAPCAVLFSNETKDGVEFTWDFGDGQSSQEKDPAAHTYNTGGTYTVILTSSNENGTDSKSDEVFVQNSTQSQLPTASFTIANNGCTAPCAISFTNTSQNGDTYSWNFGDGSNGSSTTNPTHSYPNDGNFTVTLTATNSAGNNQNQQTVTIGNDPCAGVTCLNGGTCVNGSCNCPTGYTGSNCGSEVTPSSMRITKITVTDFVNSGWDTFPVSSPDIKVTVGLGASCSSSLYASEYYQDAYPGPNYDFIPTSPIVISNPTATIAICLYDDDLSGEEYMAGVQLSPYSSDEGFPSVRTITISGMTCKVYYTYFW
jgi:PKD repeat protein